MEHKEVYSNKIKKTSIPGDELIPFPGKIITHSIKINAHSETVWPWLAQLGSGRAGWYSFDRIDNAGVASAKKIIPELQNVKIGDIMPAVPGTRDAFIIQYINPGIALVLVVPIKSAIEEPDPLQRMLGPLRVSWLLTLETIKKGQTRLISRGRISKDWLVPSYTVNPLSNKKIFIERIYDLLSRLPWFIMIPIAKLGHSLMVYRMLQGIKRRSEMLS